MQQQHRWIVGIAVTIGNQLDIDFAPTQVRLCTEGCSRRPVIRSFRWHASGSCGVNSYSTKRAQQRRSQRPPTPHSSRDRRWTLSGRAARDRIARRDRGRRIVRIGNRRLTIRDLLATKTIVATALLPHLADGSVALTAPVARYLPGFGDNGKDGVTVLQLLTMQGGFPQAPIGPDEWGSSEGRRQQFAEWKLAWPAGTRTEYHPIAAPTG